AQPACQPRAPDRRGGRSAVSSPGLNTGTGLMQHEEPGRGGALGPRDWLKAIPFQAVAASDRLGWVGLEAARYRASPAWGYDAPALTHHRLVLVTRPPQEL